MASLPFPAIYNDAQHAGNGTFVVDSNNVLWCVSNSFPNGCALFSSNDNGITFTQVATLTGIVGTLGFDPAICIDSSNNITIIGEVPNLLGTNGTNLVMYYYSSGLTGPFTITNTGVVGSDYDVIPLANGSLYIITTVVTESQTQLQGIEVSTTGTIQRTDILATDNFMGTGVSYAAVSAVSADGVNIEIYVGVLPRQFQFTADSRNQSSSQIYQFVISNGMKLSLASLYNFQSTYIPDKLLVIAVGTTRYFCMGYLDQSGNTVIGSVILGQATIATPGEIGTWKFTTRLGTPHRSILQPTLFYSQTGDLVLGSIQTTPSTLGGDGQVVLEDIIIS